MGQQRTFEEFLVNAFKRSHREGDCIICDINPTHRYAQSTFNGKHVQVHRVVLEAKLGRPLRDNMLACHTINCTSKRCINPEHLYEGTFKQNLEDRYIVEREANWF